MKNLSALRAFLNSDLPMTHWLACHPDVSATPPVTPGFRGALIHHLERICGGAPPRKQFLFAIFRVDSSKSLSERQWSALGCYLDPEKIGGEYVVRASVVAEIRGAMTELMIEGMT